MRAPLGTAMELDETICKRPGCQHPQCWVTMRRIEQGHPRLRPPPPTARRPPQDEGRLPVLSVSTLPASGVLHHGSDSPHLSERASSTTVYTSAATCSMEKFFFPGVNSYREILAPSRSSGSSFSSWKPQQAEILRPSFQDAKRDVTLVWVPNAQHRPPRKEDGEKHLKVWIKDLTLSDPQGGTRREKTNPALTINRKQKKPPSGGCPLNLTLVGSSPRAKKFIEAREVQEQPEKTWRSRRRQREPWPDNDSVTSPSLSGIIVGNRRVILHDTREKCPAVPHTGPVYRLDNQPSAAPDDTEINLDRIRNQYYLWKKYTHRADPSHRIKPPDHRANRIQRSHTSSVPDQLGHIGLFPCDPDSALSYYKSQALERPTEMNGERLGSLVCDPTRSHDSEDRNSPSLAGLSQRSWSDEEPSGTPTETGDQMQQEIPREINKEAQPAKPPELDVPADEESTRPNMSCDQSESAMETTDAQENPGGATSSPQPHPPPPSPIN